MWTLTAIVGSLCLLCFLAWHLWAEAYVCGGSRQVHHISQSYAMRHYYETRLVKVKGSVDISEGVDILGANPNCQTTTPSLPKPVSPAADEGFFQWTFCGDHVNETFKQASQLFSHREKKLAFDISKVRCCYSPQFISLLLNVNAEFIGISVILTCLIFTGEAQDTRPFH